MNSGAPMKGVSSSAATKMLVALERIDTPLRHDANRLPKEWTYIVRNFAKAVLKECPVAPDSPIPPLHIPRNLYQFAADYFNCMHDEQINKQKRKLSIQQCRKLYADICDDQKEDNVALSDLQLYVLGLGISKPVFQNIITLCFFPNAVIGTSVNRLDFVAFACTLIHASDVPNVIANIAAVFGLSPKHFISAISALARVDSQNGDELLKLIESINNEICDTITMEYIENHYSNVRSIGLERHAPSSLITSSVDSISSVIFSAH
jgi:hypothetical protein